MKKILFAILALCSLSFAQTTVLPKTTVFPKTTIFGSKVGGGVSISSVQSTGCVSSTAVASQGCAFSSNPASGNLIIVACSAWEGVHGFSTPTDTLGTTFALDLDVNSSGGGATTGEEIEVYQGVATSSGTDTVTCPFTTGSDFIQMTIREVHGVSTLDKTGTLVPGTATNSCSVTTSGTPVVANEYVETICAKDQQGAWSLGAGYINLVSESNAAAAHSQGSEDNVSSNANSGAQTGTMTVAGTAGNMTGAVITIK